MKAILNDHIRGCLKYVPRSDMISAKARLLNFVRTGWVYDKRIGLCNNLHTRDLFYTITKTQYPIKGYVWETNQQAYNATVFDRVGEKYKGTQLKQRRKLAIKLINVIEQYLKETS